ALAAGVGASARVAVIAGVVLGAFRHAHETPDLVSAQRAMLLALPAIALYRIANGTSRGLGIMQHDALSGGLLHSLAKIGALVAFVWLGLPRVVGGGGTAVIRGVPGVTAAAARACGPARHW